MPPKHRPASSFFTWAKEIRAYCCDCFHLQVLRNVSETLDAVYGDVMRTRQSVLQVIKELDDTVMRLKAEAQAQAEKQTGQGQDLKDKKVGLGGQARDTEQVITRGDASEDSQQQQQQQQKKNEASGSVTGNPNNSSGSSINHHHDSSRDGLSDPVSSLVTELGNALGLYR
jgi:hypothetical protein